MTITSLIPIAWHLRFRSSLTPIHTILKITGINRNFLYLYVDYVYVVGWISAIYIEFH